MTDYIAIIHKEPKSDYGVSFPDFPGCMTAGSSLDEARAWAEEALQFHVRGMTEDGDAIPEPSSLDDIMACEDFRDGVAILIPLRPTSPRTVRVNITLQDDVLKQVDDFAAARGLTRSGFLTAAAREVMARA